MVHPALEHVVYRFLDMLQGVACSHKAGAYLGEGEAPLVLPLYISDYGISHQYLLGIIMIRASITFIIYTILAAGIHVIRIRRRTPRTSRNSQQIYDLANIWQMMVWTNLNNIG